VSFPARANALEARWQRLCATYLPRAPQGSLWRHYDGQRRRVQPKSGWKLHVSATVLNAPTILKKIGPLLVQRGVPFKAPGCLQEVLKLNSGLYYGYTQVGKIFTVYPATDREAVALAKKLHQLTRRLAGPTVPFDLKFAEPGNVYYRFGAYQQIEIEHQGQRALGMCTADGSLIPDIREKAKPDSIADPFELHKPQTRSKMMPDRSMRVIRVLTQRGKGGVYEAVEYGDGIPKLCLLKEGRKNGELAWDGRDGAWRVKHEQRVLSRLSSCDLPIPKVLDSFELDGNYYLVIEHVNGENLYDLLLHRRRRFDLRQVVEFGIQLATFLSHMHSAGWSWRDCKPKNILITRQNRVVPIDFEGATPIRRPDRTLWGTPGYTPPEWRTKNTTGVSEDCYALGALIYSLLTGRTFDHEKPVPVQKLRRNVYPELCRLVESLLSVDQRTRLTAAAARIKLTAISLKYSPKLMRAQNSKAA